MDELYEYEGFNLPGLQGLLVPLMQGRVKLSKPTLRKLEKELEKREKRRLRREAPMCRKPGYYNHKKKQWKKYWKESKERNPYKERGVKRRYTRFVKRARENGIECTLTYPEWEILFEGVLPEDNVGVLRIDASKGYSFDNVVLKRNPKSVAGKLARIRDKLRKATKQSDTAQIEAAEH